MKQISRRDLIKAILIGGAAVGITQADKFHLGGLPSAYAAPLAEIESGELLLPFSVSPFERPLYVGPINGRSYQGHKVDAWLDEDFVMSLIFRVPGSLPVASTPTLIVEGMSNAQAGQISIRAKWISNALADSIDVSSDGLLLEPTRTVSWTLPGSHNLLHRLLISLGSSVIQANELVLLDITFQQALSTIIQESFWNFAIVWN